METETVTGQVEEGRLRVMEKGKQREREKGKERSQLQKIDDRECSATERIVQLARLEGAEKQRANPHLLLQVPAEWVPKLCRWVEETERQA